MLEQARSLLWLRRVEPFARPLLRAYAGLNRGMTLGVQGMVIDAEGRLLLIQQTYTPGWGLPGGGVERDEPAQTALGRELVEEAGVEVVDPPTLVSVHLNARWSRRDHVLLYRVSSWRPCRPTARGEIHARAWFHPDDLPSNVSPGARARIREMAEGGLPDPFW